MDINSQLGIAEVYTGKVGGPIEIDKEKGTVFVVDHETKEWASVETILNKYFIRMEVTK